MSQPSPISEPTLAEQARTLAHTGRFGTLATHSRKLPGYPFPSLVAFAEDRSGCPLLLLSRLAEHTRNLAGDARASLSIAPHSPAPLASARLSLIGSVEKVSPGELEAMRGIYVSTHPEAKAWLSFGDFGLRRLRVEQAYLVAGFGRMGWIAAEDYAAAAADPLADDASAIIEHMNADHSDALPLYCRTFGGTEAQAAKMIDVDSRGMLLLVQTEKGNQTLRIAFPRLASTADELRKLLIEMLRTARS